VTDDLNDATLTGPGAQPDPVELGTCRIEARIATGAASRVYRAVDTELQRTVVVKMFLAQPEDPRAIDRVLEAARKLAGFKHQHVVPVLKFGIEGTTPYVVFEYLDGEDVERAVRRERTLVPAAAARIVLDAASGLHAVYERGLLHGDVRPRHLIRVKGETKVTGFALSPQYKTAQGRRFFGHPAYLAPEIAMGGRSDHRADIYSLGSSLFELVTGRPPYGAAGPDALVACHVHEPFPTLKSAGVEVPKELEEFLAKLVAKQADKRFQTYVEVLQAGAAILPSLRRLVTSEPTLTIEEGRQAGLVSSLPEGDFLLGRVIGEGLALDDARVSRRHAMVRRKGDYIEVEDLSSRNGIRVNGVEVRAKQLTNGDKLEIGDTILRLDIPRSAALPTVMPPVPASPVRGAFGNVEIVHPPNMQATATDLSKEESVGGPQGLQLLAKLAPLLARTQRSIQPEILKAAGEVLGADDRLVVKIEKNQAVFEATSSHEAQLLSCVLPAIERALPGQLALATAVRVGTDDRWSVLLAPIKVRGTTTALFVLIKKAGTFDESSLAVLEGACALLSVRAEESS
jgi:serine/threonine protein kinase